jgi:hypothetical protein
MAGFWITEYGPVRVGPLEERTLRLVEESRLMGIEMPQTLADTFRVLKADLERVARWKWEHS